MSTSAWLGAAAFCAVSGLSSQAHAEWTFGAEARGELMFTDPLRGGPGGALSLGYALDTYPILIVPEVVASAGVWPDEPPLVPFRAQAGIRFGLTTVVEPAIFFHAGYGFVARKSDLDHGFVLDAGLSVDGRLQRELTLGGALGYQGFIGSGSAHGMFAAFRIGYWFD